MNPTLRNQPLTQANSIEELRVSNGQARYCSANGKLLGLHLADSQLTDNELTELLQASDTSALQVLHIARNSLTRLDFKIHPLPALKFLDARGNEKLIKVDLSGCPQLKKVVLNGCALSELMLPESLSELAQLEVANNALTELSLNGSVGELRFLDVSNNQLTALPTVLAGARNNFYLLAQGNRLDEIISGILQDEKFADEERLKRLKDYLTELNKEDAIEVNTARVIFLGNTQVGKTTLADVLTGRENAKKGSTHGVNILAWEVPKSGEENTKVIGIDFGGQDYYHNIHFALFNKAAIYLILWGNGQQDAYGMVKNQKTEALEDIYPIDYWLGSVDYFMQSRLPTIESRTDEVARNIHLIQNQAVQNGAPEPIRSLNNKSLIEVHGIKNFYEICLEENQSEKREAAKRAIETLINSRRIIRIRGKVYVDVEAEIEKQRKAEVVLLSISALREAKNIDQEKLDEILDNLSYTITCLLLDAEDIPADKHYCEVLTSFFIIDLEKFTDWLYSILTIEELRNTKNGYFRREDAERWLPKNAKPHLKYILGFMLHHKIIFEVKGEVERYVVPQYLKPLVAESVDALFLSGFDVPLVQYRFESYFHSNILSELIGQCYESLLQPNKLNETEKSQQEEQSGASDEAGWKYVMWKNKVVLYNEKETPKRFLLLEFQLPIPDKDPKSDNLEKPTITLRRYTKEQVGDKFVQGIMEMIEKTITHYQTTKLVKAPNGEYIPFDVLAGENPRIAESGNIPGSENQKKSHLVFYNKYVYRRGDFKLYLPNEEITMKKIFISYSQHDESYKDELKKHLVTLIHENKVSTFDDRQLSLGGEWDSELKRKIDECDIMVCLISVDFLNTGYIMKTEVPRALEMGKTVVHIVVRPCDWTGSMLGAKNGVLKGKEVTLFEEKNDKQMSIFRSATREERDMFWLQVVKEFRDKAFVNEE